MALVKRFFVEESEGGPGDDVIRFEVDSWHHTFDEANEAALGLLHRYSDRHHVRVTEAYMFDDSHELPLKGKPA